MTESEWLASTEPAAMLNHLHITLRGGERLPADCLSDRKLRLFACACCRQVWDLLTDDSPCERCRGTGTVMVLDREKEKQNARLRKHVMIPPQMRAKCKECCGSGTGRINRSRRAVEVAERFVDGKATAEERGRYYPFVQNPLWEGDHAAASCCDPNAASAATRVVRFLGNQGNPQAQADLLRHIVGNPFHSVRLPYYSPRFPHPVWCCPSDPIRLDNDATCSCLTPTVLDLAQSLYDGKDCAPILHDALEQEGAPAELVEHFDNRVPCTTHSYEQPNIGGWFLPPDCEWCKGSGWKSETKTHPKGCWALDLLLGKE